MTVTTEIIAIGNELLIGDVQDTNTHWLCQRITGLGGMVLRATLVRDDPQVIGEVLLQAVQRGTQVIFTTGGLGPTADDLTLSAMATALGRPLEEHPEALRMVQETYMRLAQAGYVAHAELTPERRKMAILPAGAQPLYNPVGAAPGVLLRQASTTIITLPGVPAELQGIFEQSLTPILQELYGQGYYAERMLIVDCGDESALAPAVDAVQRGHPEVYVKSRAKAYGPGVRLKITLSARGAGKEEADGRLSKALEELRGRLEALHIPIVQIS